MDPASSGSSKIRLGRGFLGSDGQLELVERLIEVVPRVVEDDGRLEAGVLLVVVLGDIVDLGEASGVVEAISLRTTQLRDVNGTVWYVPNGEILRVANKSQQWARAVLDIEVAYDTDIDHAKRVIKEVADSVWDEHLAKATIIEEPEIWGVEMFGENAIAIRLVVKTEPGEQFNTAREIRGRLVKAFDREGIEIPFPQRVIWTRQKEAPATEVE